MTPIKKGVYMRFYSILFDKNKRAKELSSSLDFYRDLNLDQIIDTAVSYKKEYDFKKFFYTPLDNIETITYRQEIIKDLQNDEFYIRVDEFCQEMLEIEKYQKLIKELDYDVYKNSWFLQMALVYVSALESFYDSLKSVDLHSKGLLLFREFLKTYLQSDEFKSLRSDMQSLKKQFDSIIYDITIDGLTFKVKRYEGEEDYTQKIKKVFKRFEQDDVNETKSQFDKNRGMNHVNAKILEFVAKLYPKIFATLREFCDKYENFIDKTFQTFAGEVEFYISYLSYISQIKERFCFPQISGENKSIRVMGGFDLALAYSLVFEKKKVVTNDYALEKQERIMIVSGANQGGKSTFSRAFGQINYLASLGLPVPANEAKLFLVTRVFTHFEREEHIGNLHSKLQEDLVRIHKILESATPKSLVILNEIFSSTSLKDAIYLSKKIMEKIVDLDLFCIWVTFIEELNNLNKKTVSMVSLIDANDIENRTYKIIKKESDGLAYAKSIAKKYRLSSEQILKRIDG